MIYVANNVGAEERFPSRVIFVIILNECVSFGC